MSDTFERWNAKPLGKYETRRDSYPSEPHPWIVNNAETFIKDFPDQYENIVEVGAWQCHSAEVLRQRYGDKYHVEATEIDTRKVAEFSEVYPDLKITAEDAATVARRYSGKPTIFIAHNVLTHVPVRDLEDFLTLIRESKSALLHKTIGLKPDDHRESWTSPKSNVVNYYNFTKIAERFGFETHFSRVKPYARDNPEPCEENLCFRQRGAYQSAYYVK